MVIVATEHSTQRDEREAVLLLPGMTLNATIFPPLPFPTLSIDFTELSGSPPGGMRGYLTLLDDALAATAFPRTPRRVVVAHSFGGMLALSWLAARPDLAAQLTGLVLIGTTAGPMFDVVDLRLARAMGREWRIKVSPLMPLWNTPTVTRMVKRLLSGGRLTVSEVDFRRLRWRGDLAVELLGGWRNTRWQAMRAFRHAMSGFDVRDRLASISVPTIVLHGTDDSFFPVTVARSLTNGLANAELRVVKGAAHLLPLTHGEEVARAVAALLP